MMKYLIGNWKANKTLDEARSWIREVKSRMEKVHPDLRVALCPSFIHLRLLKDDFPELTLGCQDLSPYGDGAYTGAVTARMLEGLVEFVILGHSERRRWFQETSLTVAQKAVQALDFGITPIIAVHTQNWREQLRALDDSLMDRVIIMYEPPEAISSQIGPIGQGDAAPLEEVKAMVEKIKERQDVKTVIYGGSVKSHNLTTFLSEPQIDGVLAGSASLDAEEWVRMIRIASEAIEAQAKQ